MDTQSTNQSTNQLALVSTNQPELQISYAAFTPAKLTCSPPEQKQIPGTGPNAIPPSAPQYYHQIQMMYNYGNEESRVLNEFLIEGCEMESKFGIQSKSGPSGRPEHSVMCMFDMNTPDQANFIECLSRIHNSCAFILQQFKGVVKMPHFNSQMAEATGLKSAVYRVRDELSGEPIQGRSPSMFMKLFSRGKPPTAEQTLFTDLTETPVPWTLLTGVEIKFVPLIHIKKIFIGGGKASIQMEIVSAVVTSVVARNTKTRQTGTIDRLKGERPELVDKIAAQLAKLTADRQDQLLANDKQDKVLTDGKNGEEQPTFSGIVPTRQQPTNQPPFGTPTFTGLLPSIPSLNVGVPTMQDFVSSAPVRQVTGYNGEGYQQVQHGHHVQHGHQHQQGQGQQGNQQGQGQQGVLRLG